ncbi:MAG: hypothetical protein ACPGQL_07965 [Thermoplasmatota archaeon]
MNPAKIALLLATALVAALAMTPTAVAHGHATVVEAGEARCYLVTSTLGAEVEFWMETNGILTGGEASGPAVIEGLPVSGVPFWDAGELALGFVGGLPVVGDLLEELTHDHDHDHGDGDDDDHDEEELLHLEDGQSGLQRAARDWNGDGTIDPADTMLTADEFLASCF